MRRLALAAFVAVVALAQVGIEQSSSEASSAPAPHPVVRARATTVDQARSSLPLPRPGGAVDSARLLRRPGARASRSSSGGPWAALARCESGGDTRARSAGGTYFGAFQFSLATWRSLGYGGNPVDHPYAVQLEAAKRLQARSGWGQWPRCARRLGLV